MKVLLIGSGGREAALAWAISRSKLLTQLDCAPGNAGIARHARCIDLSATDVEAITTHAVEQQYDLVVVGPEAPLVDGLVDRLKAQGIAAFGPNAAAARMEGSKIFAKRFMERHGIPTGDFEVVEEIASARSYLEDDKRQYPLVIKADGLAAGKGVIIAEDPETATKTVTDMIDGGAFGDSGKTVLIEECLFGEETSIHVIVSGKDYVILPTSQDHKQVFEGDTGPNTGGMGAYSPADLIDDSMMRRIEAEIVKPSVDGIAAEGIDFRGTLFIGLMMTTSGPKVLEYNTRFGDPETQVLLTRLETDPIAIMLAAAKGELDRINVKVKDEYAMVVVLASDGYPGSYPKGEAISIPEDVGENEFIFHAGTKVDENGALVTNGGRILGVTALGSDLSEASQRAYALCDRIDFKSKYLRRDIGAKELERAK